MADSMLQGEFSKDPNKPFSTRVDEVAASFDALVLECGDLYLALEKQDAAHQAQTAELIKKKLEVFNSLCDELYKEIMRRKEKLVNASERATTKTDLHRQIETAGNIAQMMGEFRHFLNTGKVPATK